LFQRIIDNVPRVIDKDFLWALSNMAQEVLISKLGLGSRDVEERARNFLEEDPDVVGRRQTLITSLRRLEDVCERLTAFSIGPSLRA
jgi:hypothetical protein